MFASYIYDEIQSRFGANGLSPWQMPTTLEDEVDAGAAEDSPSFCCDVDPPGGGTNVCRRTDDGRLQVAQAPVNAATAALWEGMWRCPESRRKTDGWDGGAASVAE